MLVFIFYFAVSKVFHLYNRHRTQINFTRRVAKIFTSTTINKTRNYVLVKSVENLSSDELQHFIWAQINCLFKQVMHKRNIIFTHV